MSLKRLGLLLAGLMLLYLVWGGYWLLQAMLVMK